MAKINYDSGDDNINQDDAGLIYTPIPKAQWHYLYKVFGRLEDYRGAFKALTVSSKNKKFRKKTDKPQPEYYEFWMVHDHFMDFIEKYGVDRILKEGIKFSWFEDYSTPPDDRRS